jgi:hypothetical protein
MLQLSRCIPETWQSGFQGNPSTQTLEYIGTNVA